MALLTAFFLVAHSLDFCAAHTGIPNLSPISANIGVIHNGVVCSAPPGVACLCADCACVPFPLDSHHDDGCASTSELSTLTHSFGIHLKAPVIVSALFATVADTLDAPTPLAVFLGGDGPPLAQLRSQYLLSPLPGRAPPISA